MEFEGGNKASYVRRKRDSAPDAKVKKKGKKKRTKPTVLELKAQGTGQLILKQGAKNPDETMTNINYESDGEKKKIAQLTRPSGNGLIHRDQKPMLLSGINLDSGSTHK